jgi:cytochrome c peroxidase
MPIRLGGTQFVRRPDITAAGDCLPLAPPVPILERNVAVAYLPDGTAVLQTRGPATLRLVRATNDVIELSSVAPEDPGNALFHSATIAGIACASCHPEAGDDGRVWNFEGIGGRRTQSLRTAGLVGTEPFHWDGDMTTLAQLMTRVFGERMGGGELTTAQMSSLIGWLDVQRPTASGPAGDPGAVARGRELFNSPDVGCQGCHSGAHLTNNASVNVGTGGAFQVPSLFGIAWRAPYMHNGCAATLRDRFGACGGGDMHGHTSQLAAAQIGDLVAYLETL